MWKRGVRGLVLTFHLAGINNQNFIMRDDQTGTFWQQISGRAISGPLKGAQLAAVHSDELGFGVWRAEQPAGTVLKPDAPYASEYETKHWDVRMAKAPVVLNFPGTALASRELVLGVTAFGASKAYPLRRVLSEKLVQDRLGAEPVIVVVGPDNQSIRMFNARLKPGEAAPDFYRTTEAILLDSASGSHWNFAGCAVDGPMTGKCLTPVDALKDYWFDWRNYHPDTSVWSK